MREANFSDVLDTACRSAGIDPRDAASAGPRRMQGAAAHLRQLADQILDLAARASLAVNALDSYFEHQSEPRPATARKPSDPAAVASELRITSKMTSTDLSRLRRQFARANHPDRADVCAREDATRRMMIANMLIDAELKRRHAAQAARSR